MSKIPRPVLLCVLDGFGLTTEAPQNNAILGAEMRNYNRMLKTYPHSQLYTSGLDVGLPEGQMGNSEVGHSTMGAGRIIYQDLPRIDKAIESGEFAKNPKLLGLIKKLKETKGTCHLLGLASDGGVHSHLRHLIFLAQTLKVQGIPLAFHLFLDGRDVAQKSARCYLNELIQLGFEAEIKTVAGRYYAMDRDNNWSRTESAYQAIAGAKSERVATVAEAVNQAYSKNLTDEFILPAVIEGYKGVKDGDALLFFNFRADRIRQLASAFVDPDFAAFKTKKLQLSACCLMTEYSAKLATQAEILFPSFEIKNSLPELLAKQKLIQLRIAETEKYAHVTFFFSCGKEEKLPGEDRILVKSPNVATYDLKPEMAAFEVGEKLRAAIKSGKYDFIIVNYANCDMVGHSGKLNAAIKACEAIDLELAKLEQEILEVDGAMIITADHGNIECMMDGEGNPHTAHTLNPVPFILVKKEAEKLKVSDGRLCDIAPTILQLMKIEKPEEMTGKSLII